jgi:two-component system, OmpR family, sensor kinase
MSSSPPNDVVSPAPATRSWRSRFAGRSLRRRLLAGILALFAGWSLRRRLLAGILALFAVVCLLIGATSALAINQYLVHQLDGQLRAVAARAELPHDRRGSEGPFTPGQPLHTVYGRVVNGAVTEAQILMLTPSANVDYQPSGPEVTATPLSTRAADILATVPVDGKAHTIALDHQGEYRIVATPAQSGGGVVVTGLPMSDLRNTVWQLIGIEVSIALGGLLVAALASAAIVRLSLRPLSRVAATAAQVAELPLARGDVDLSVRVPDADTDPRTEVGQMGAALNRMLGHVGDALAIRHASEMRVRQFVADASHELRTPLAAIRGYAELTRRGRDTVAPDIAHALGRVESESARMTTLVDDLLLLARLDSGRPLDRDPMELSGLVVDAVNDAHAAGREHKWLLDLPDEAVTVPGDTARMHQVLTNLLANARTHTPPGTTVTTSLTVEGDQAVISVTDNGPGIPSQLLPDIFERFARGDSSRSRAAGSTGLGLAIVAAVVEAHQGRVEVKSCPGRTSFMVRLPGAARS